MPKSINNARAAVVQERERLQASIREMEAQLAEVDTAIAALDRLVNERVPSARRRSPGSSNGATAKSPATPRAGRNRLAPSMLSLIESFVRDQGRKAVHATDVLAHLESIGRAPGGRNPKATIQTTLAELQKRGSITNVGKNRWRRAPASAPQTKKSESSAEANTSSS